MTGKLRIGLLNIMPEAEKYELSILKLLTHPSINVELVLIKVNNHAYKSSDKYHLNKHYISFDKAIENKKLDGLLLTGAPVETMSFENITYWNELLEIFEYAHQNVISTLGLCWGGIAIGKYFGIEKTIFTNKIFGVFTSEYLQKQHWMTENNISVFNCPQSRYAGLNETDLSNAAKMNRIRLLAYSDEAGHTIFESTDQRFVAHLGHPEYDINRILFEYERDALKKLNLVPSHFNVASPTDNWGESSQNFFSSWLQMINKKN
ncbi:MAG: homoserine O-acetyltransferase/O-succinyltransferase family protein [Bacteroidales bacterium]